MSDIVLKLSIYIVVIALYILAWAAGLGLAVGFIVLVLRWMGVL